jgi:hypothetical protein
LFAAVTAATSAADWACTALAVALSMPSAKAESWIVLIWILPSP